MAGEVQVDAAAKERVVGDGGNVTRVVHRVNYNVIKGVSKWAG